MKIVEQQIKVFAYSRVDLKLINNRIIGTINLLLKSHAFSTIFS